MSSSSSSSSSSLTYPAVVHHHLPAHISVLTLNRRAAFHLERDEYEQAIDVLVTALKIWETVEVNDEEDMECCNSSIDECILQGRHLSPQALFNRYNNNNKKESSYEQENNEGQEGFVYRQPILTTSQFWRKDRIPTGNTLSLILILNLAMAHHLSGLKANRCKRKLQKALQLYELAHQLQLEEGFCSPQATMIITNNVGEIHRSVNNHQKHTMCLRHLLSTMMYMVDNNTNEHYTSNTMTTDNDVWDGFLRNTSQLILQRNCAGAA